MVPGRPVTTLSLWRFLWILHGEMFDGFDSDGYVGYWAARVDGSEVIFLFSPGGWVDFLFWVGQSSFYVADGTVTGFVALRYIDLATVQTTTVFDVKKYGVCCGVPSTFAIDPLNKSLTYMLTGNFDNTPYQDTGIYISSVAEPQQKLVDTFPSSKTYSYSLIDDFGDFVAKPQCEDNTALIYVVVSGGSTYCLTEQNKKQALEFSRACCFET